MSYSNNLLIYTKSNKAFNLEVDEDSKTIHLYAMDFLIPNGGGVVISPNCRNLEELNAWIVVRKQELDNLGMVVNEFAGPVFDKWDQERNSPQERDGDS